MIAACLCLVGGSPNTSSCHEGFLDEENFLVHFGKIWEEARPSLRVDGHHPLGRSGVACLSIPESAKGPK
eukprot:2226582-Amphidinium_carterae.1